MDRPTSDDYEHGLANGSTSRMAEEKTKNNPLRGMFSWTESDRRLNKSRTRANGTVRFEAWNDESEFLARSAHTVRLETEGFGQHLVLRESNSLRRFWGIVVTILLVYTGLIFPYKLCFIDFHTEQDADSSDTAAWSFIETLVDTLFWIDLFAAFFFSQKDDDSNVEICDLKIIAWRYLTGFFLVNLTACLPPAWFKVILGDTEDTGVNRSLRLTRLHRTSRLARLARLSRLAKLAPFLRESSTWQYIQAFRGVRMTNLTVGLLWVVHIGACGWYLCAAMHEDIDTTWIARRSLDADGLQLLRYEDPFTIWVHSFYFILTVFTTVGFGDMSALTRGEIGYVNCVMIVGTVVNSIIMSEVITTLTGVDKLQAELNKRCSLIQDFAEHAHLSPRVQLALEDAVKKSKALGIINTKEMRGLFSSNYVPRSLLGQLPRELFQGQLIANQFLSEPLRQIDNMPPRLPVLMALFLTPKVYDCGEILYQNTDMPVHFFLVLNGVFAHVGIPQESGGKDPLPPAAITTANTFGSATSKTKIFNEISTDDLFHAHDMQELFPYQLFGFRNYFGEHELLLGLNMRQGYCRCESGAGGTVLAMDKQEFHRFQGDFPVFNAIWVQMAKRREAKRKKLLKKLRMPGSYKLLAIRIIQRVWRKMSRIAKTPKRERRMIVDSDDDAKLKPQNEVSHQSSYIQWRSGRETDVQAGKSSSDVQELRSHMQKMDERMEKIQNSVDLLLQVMGLKVSQTNSAGQNDSNADEGPYLE